MSSILKALRKLQEDKAALGEGNIDIARDILKRRYDTSPAPGRQLLVGLAVVILGAVFAAACWWYWPENPQLNSVAEQPPVAASALQSPAEQQSTPLIKNTAAPSPGHTTDPSPVIIYSTVNVSKQQGPSIPASAEKPVVKPAHVVIPDLQVTQIVYQPQPEARMAIVNDLPVMEATEIEGATVVEILSDRVRFSFQGVEFVKQVKILNQ